MPNDLPHRRNSLRYPDHDYSSDGAVFVTICIHDRQELFGSIGSGDSSLSQYGEFALQRWEQIPNRFKGVALDEFIIMPDHLHGILWFGTSTKHDPPDCSDVVTWFKVVVQRDISLAVKLGAPRYREKLWQRSYYDRIIRDDRELEAIREYIIGNPYRWIEKRQI